MTHRPRWSVWFLKVLSATLLALAVLSSALWMLFEHKPAWYSPIVADADMVMRARASTAAIADYISDRSAEGAPFEVTLSELEVNQWLASISHLWPAAAQKIPHELSQPAASFDDGLIRVGALFERRKLRFIINVEFAVEAQTDRPVLLLRLSRVRGGSLPIPNLLLDSWLDQLLLKTSAPAQNHFASIRSSEGGLELERVFVWPNGKTTCRIESITVDDGKIRIGIRPL